MRQNQRYLYILLYNKAIYETFFNVLAPLFVKKKERNINYKMRWKKREEEERKERKKEGRKKRKGDNWENIYIQVLSLASLYDQ